jgi:D-3-phosphoglycerate dehydrogenase
LKKIFIADRIAEIGITYLKSHPGFEVVVEPGLGEAQLCERIRDCEAVIVRSAPRITAPILASAHKLKVIGRAGIGVDNIDVEAATERGVVVLNTPDANAITTTELTLAHILSLSRHLPQADRSVRAGEWKRAQLVGTELAGKTVGIIGFGTIGRIVASRCLGLNMHVVAYDPFVTREVIEQAGAAPGELEELLKTSDYVTLHCPLMDKTRHLLNRDRLLTMKPGARLINCARGGLVDEAALLEVIASGHLAGAALDVYEKEPPLGSPLLKEARIVFTPHLGASTEEAQVAVGVAIARQVAAFLETGEAINAVNLPHVPAEDLPKIRPYQVLAHRLGRLLAALTPEPLYQIEVALCGRAFEIDPHPVAVEALVGLLEEQLSTPVNSVNARHLAHRQGLALSESRSEETQEYLSLLTLTGHYPSGAVSVAGTLLGDRYPRLVRIDDYEIETVPEGTLLITRHDDRPGVVGALGNLLGQEHINISRMQVGITSPESQAMAVIGISSPLSPELLHQVETIPAVHRVYQVSL